MGRVRVAKDGVNVTVIIHLLPPSHQAAQYCFSDENQKLHEKVSDGSRFAILLPANKADQSVPAFKTNVYHSCGRCTRDCTMIGIVQINLFIVPAWRVA